MLRSYHAALSVDLYLFIFGNFPTVSDGVDLYSFIFGNFPTVSEA